MMLGLSFVAYLGLVGAIGLLAWRRTHSVDDFLLGGRRIGASFGALSAGASDMSGWLLLGLPGLAVIDPQAAVLTACGLVLGTWCNWRFVARPLRDRSAALKTLTLPAYFAQSFPEYASALRTLSAVAIVCFFLLYTSAGLVAGGKLFNAVFNVPYAAAVCIGAVVILLYTLFGGYLAVVWTDALQAIMMALALVVVATLLWLGTDIRAAAVVAAPRSAIGGVGVLSALAWGLGYCGQPHILMRFMSLDARASVSRARRVGTTWAACGLVAAVIIGIGGATLIPGGGDPEHVFILAVDTLLPPALAGLCLAAILAAIMSTADSQLLVTASALAEDLPLSRRRRERNAGERLRAGRYAVILVGIGALVLALDPQAGVFDLVARAWAGFGATIGPALLVNLYRSNATGAGALCGMVCGMAAVVVWPLLPQNGWGIYELLPAFIIATGANLAINHYQAAQRRR